MSSTDLRRSVCVSMNTPIKVLHSFILLQFENLMDDVSMKTF